MNNDVITLFQLLWLTTLCSLGLGQDKLQCPAETNCAFTANTAAMPGQSTWLLGPRNVTGCDSQYYETTGNVFRIFNTRSEDRECVVFFSTNDDTGTVCSFTPSGTAFREGKIAFCIQYPRVL
jgi:hypothetical protein